jgi:60 kDa SS-A/Ro ribonucleoprotein
MKTNIKSPVLKTHEGGTAKHINAEMELRRSVMACLLWENTFYENGEDVAERIRKLCALVPLEKLSAIAIEARGAMNLRHAPLLIVREMARHPKLKNNPALVSKTLSAVIQRADELAEFVSLYWKDGKTPLSAQVKKGLAQAFRKFNEYQIAKYNRDETIKLRDVLFLTHSKPQTTEQEALYKKLIDGALGTPDTWEVALSTGKDKKEVWEHLLSEKKLGALAFLRNLRNMQDVKVSYSLITDYAETMKTDRVLPFRFIAAARAIPNLEPLLEKIMLKQDYEKLDGETVLLVDVSGSMSDPLAGKSDMRRIDAASGLAILLRQMTDNLRVYTFNQEIREVPPRRGFALRDAIGQPEGSTRLGGAVNWILKNHPDARLIVISDEQTEDRVPDPINGKAYMLNVSSNKNGVGYGAWKHVDGFSEQVVKWIQEIER